MHQAMALTQLLAGQGRPKVGVAIADQLYSVLGQSRHQLVVTGVATLSRHDSEGHTLRRSNFAQTRLSNFAPTRNVNAKFRCRPPTQVQMSHPASQSRAVVLISGNDFSSLLGPCQAAGGGPG